VSYPAARYLGQAGEASATVRRAEVPAELVYANGTHCYYLATGRTTEGLFGLYRWEMGPEPSGPGPHFHRTMAESFYVLAGTLSIFDGRHWVDTQAGDFVHVPAGGIHGFRNESGAPASMLIHFSPGAPREAFFEGTARHAREGLPGADELADFYQLHDQYMVMPAGRAGSVPDHRG
jgi:mannose-6-phosphate isomerase-like protein (cupin superfamily)